MLSKHCKNAGVVQWQNPSLPSWLRGSDSLHPLQTKHPFGCFLFRFVWEPLFEFGRLCATLKFSLSHRKSSALLRPLDALDSFPFTRSKRKLSSLWLDFLFHKKCSALSLAIFAIPTKREIGFAISVGTLLRSQCCEDFFVEKIGSD